MKKIYWTREKCQEEALKYKTRVEFNNKSHSCYNASVKNKWLNEICKHMSKADRSIKWTKDKCQEEALKYKTKIEFNKKSNKCYSACIRNKWLDEICNHMICGRFPRKWTKEKCQEEALKYNTKNDFLKNSLGCYSMSWRKGWLDNICSHMKKPNNDKCRCIYAYEFNDNCAYIGLTYSLINRNQRHFNSKNSSVYKHYIKTNMKPKLIQLTDFLEIEIAKEKENEYVEIYKNNGWNILNKTKTGSIGSNIVKWTKKECAKEAKKYKTLEDLNKNNKTVYLTILKNKWKDLLEPLYKK